MIGKQASTVEKLRQFYLSEKELCPRSRWLLSTPKSLELIKQNIWDSLCFVKHINQTLEKLTTVRRQLYHTLNWKNPLKKVETPDIHQDIWLVLTYSVLVRVHTHKTHVDKLQCLHKKLPWFVRTNQLHNDRNPKNQILHKKYGHEKKIHSFQETRLRKQVIRRLDK